MEQIDQQNAFRENRRVLQHFGWRCYIDGTGHTWFCSEEHNQWSREFPLLFVFLSSDLKQELQRLFTQPAPEARPSQHSPSPIGPSSSSSSHQYCGVVTSISPTSRSSPLAYVTSSSPTSRSSLLAYVPSWNDCSWHRTYSWEGVPFPTTHNGRITEENVIMTEKGLASALTSIQDTLFRLDNVGFKFFYSVVWRRFRLGHVHVTHMATKTGKYCGMELACSACCRYVCVGWNSKRSTRTELQEARATLLSYTSGCQYTRPGSDDLPQR